MPNYLVRWPGLLAALVTARDEDDLIDILDETANPEGCTWSLYRGPLYVEFALNVDSSIEIVDKPRDRPLKPTEVHIGDVSKICERDVMTAVIDYNSETAGRMVAAIAAKAFPELASVLKESRETIPEDEVRVALRSELDKLLQASWQHEQTKRRPDQDSKIAASMGTSPRLVAHWTELAAERERIEETTPPAKPKKKPSSTAARRKKRS